MKNLLFSILALAVFSQVVFAQHPVKTKQQLLFDGKTTKGWHTYLKPGAKPFNEAISTARQALREARKAKVVKLAELGIVTAPAQMSFSVQA